MNRHDTNARWPPILIFAWLLLGCALFTLVVVIWGYITGRGSLGNDAHFAEFHVCLNDDTYQPVSVIPVATQTIYLCGVIEGNGLRSGVWLLYMDKQMIQSHYFEHFPGTFFERISLYNELSVGSYTIDVFSEKRVRATTQFIVSLEPPSP